MQNDAQTPPEAVSDAAKPKAIQDICRHEECTYVEIATYNTPRVHLAKCSVCGVYVNAEEVFDDLQAIFGFEQRVVSTPTYSGRIDLLHPTCDQINIDDIAVGLSRGHRFNGQTIAAYSVAQHSELVSYYCDEQDAFKGLLHDADEAYLCDMVRPVKRFTIAGVFFEVIANRLLRKIYEKFGLDTEVLMPHSVRYADEMILQTEVRDLINPHSGQQLVKNQNNFLEVQPRDAPIRAHDEKTARNLFMGRFLELEKKHRLAKQGAK
jgi:hypothetical protein